MDNLNILHNQYGDITGPRQPVVTDSVEGQKMVAAPAETITYNGKAAAGAVTINSTAYKPIISIEGDRVASYWGLKENLVYTAYVDGHPKATDHWLSTLTETATAAEFTVYDPNKNLENMFESLTTTVKRFVAKATDKTGAVLYGWVFGIAVASDTYTIDVVNNRLTETQSWVGTLASFDHTNLEKIEIFRYTSPIVFGTGTCLLEEVECKKEYSLSRESGVIAAEALTAGEYFVDYMRGEIIAKKADATASETIAYNIWAATVGGGSTLDQEVILIQDTMAALSTGSNLDVDTAAEALTATSYVTKRGVAVRTLTDGLYANTGIVYVGKDNTVTAGGTPATDGYPLQPGDNIVLEVDNPNKLWVIADTLNQKVFWAAV